MVDKERSAARGGGGDVVVRRFAGGPFAENAYLLTCAGTGKGILVDPGGATREMLAVVRAQEIEIAYIVLTHAHLDHVDGVALAQRETGAPVHLHAADEPLYRTAPHQAQLFGVPVEPLPPIDRHLEHGDTIRFGDCALAVRHTPGHAPGHVILVGDGVAIVGDCVFMGSIGRTDLPGGDFQTLMRSIREQILTLPDETILYPGHGPETTVGHERASNPFLIPDYGGSAFA